MKSFKEYANTTPSNENTIESGVTQNAGELAEKLANAYNGKSDAEMWKSILAEAEKSKRAGTLSNQEIEAFYQNFSPMLSGFQRKRLREIVDKLKNI